MNDPREAMMRAIRSGSWLDFDKLGETQSAQAQADREKLNAEAKIVQDALATPEGERFIEWLAGKTVLRAPAAEETGATTAEGYAIAKARREGQNGVFFMIMQALQMAQDPTGGGR
jgi:hypothetical protein